VIAGSRSSRTLVVIFLSLEVFSAIVPGCVSSSRILGVSACVACVMLLFYFNEPRLRLKKKGYFKQGRHFRIL
jgi:hypothetical protein